MTLVRFRPMLPVNQLVEDTSDFVHEIKWDGYRVLAYLHGGKATLESRNGHSLNRRFPQVVSALEKMDGPAVLDGEVVAFSAEGRPEFSLLQPSHGGEVQIVYIVFDILFWQGTNLCPLPWLERRQLLEKRAGSHKTVALSPLLPGNAKASLAFATEHKLEGIVSKRRDSPYLPGARSGFWRKQKITQSLDCVVVGVNVSANRIRSLIVALYEPSGELFCIGNVGSGLGQTELDFLREAISLLASEKCPVNNPPKSEGDLIWFKPHLVVEVEYLELTIQKRLRHPVFLRFRFDKEPESCQLGVD